ncbi:hypothetical protein IJT93_03770, partial [bacterium]|nr:hypothetical protein [bacterium]
SVSAKSLFFLNLPTVAIACMLKACFCLIYRPQGCLLLHFPVFCFLLCLILACGYAYKEGKYGKIKRIGKSHLYACLQVLSEGKRRSAAWTKKTGKYRFRY